MKQNNFSCIFNENQTVATVVDWENNIFQVDGVTICGTIERNELNPDYFEVEDNGNTLKFNRANLPVYCISFYEGGNSFGTSIKYFGTSKKYYISELSANNAFDTFKRFYEFKSNIEWNNLFAPKYFCGVTDKGILRIHYETHSIFDKKTVESVYIYLSKLD